MRYLVRFGLVFLGIIFGAYLVFYVFYGFPASRSTSHVSVVAKGPITTLVSPPSRSPTLASGFQQSCAQAPVIRQTQPTAPLVPPPLLTQWNHDNGGSWEFFAHYRESYRYPSVGCFWWTHIYRLFRHHGPLVGSSWLFPSFCPCTGASDIPRRVLDCSGSLSNFLFRSFGPRNSWHVNLCDFRLEWLKYHFGSKRYLPGLIWSTLSYSLRFIGKYSLGTLTRNKQNSSNFWEFLR